MFVSCGLSEGTRGPCGLLASKKKAHRWLVLHRQPTTAASWVHCWEPVDSGWTAAAAVCAGDGDATGGRLDSGTNEMDTPDAAEFAHSLAQENAEIDIGIDMLVDSAVLYVAAAVGIVAAVVVVVPNYFYY